MLVLFQVARLCHRVKLTSVASPLCVFSLLTSSVRILSALITSGAPTHSTKRSSTSPWGPSSPHSLSYSLHLQLLPYKLGLIIYPGVRPGHKFNCFNINLEVSSRESTVMCFIGRIWNPCAPLCSERNTLLSDTIRTQLGHLCLPLIRLQGRLPNSSSLSRKWSALSLVLSTSLNKMHVN